MASSALHNSTHPAIGFREFVALVAALMALNALAIDAMLPALPQIGATLGVVAENSRQWVIAAYLLGFASAQIVYGSLADRFGRKPVLLVAVAAYFCLSMVAASATVFSLLLAARAPARGGGRRHAGYRLAIVRDCYSGRQMARVMSLASTVFMVVPIIAPSLGDGDPAVRAVAMDFRAARDIQRDHDDMDGAAAARDARSGDAPPAQLRRRRGGGEASFERARFAGLYAGASDPVRRTDRLHQFRAADILRRLPCAEAVSDHLCCAAATMAAAALLNARIVVRLGMRRVSHAALLGFTLVAALHTALALAGRESC